MPYIRNDGNMKSQTEIRHFFGRAVCGRQGGSETTPKLRQDHQSIKTSSTRRYIPQNKKWNYYNTIIIARKKHKRNPGCQLGTASKTTCGFYPLRGGVTRYV